MDFSTEKDLYELLGAERSHSVSEIKKAYRKKALTCHPDKHPDNPRAAELFHELTRALEVLTDDAARAAYDKVVDARQRAKLRVKELDARRKKFKEELEARENASRSVPSEGPRQKTEEEKFRAEVERLRKEGSRQVEEEVALVTQRIRQELLESRGKSSGCNSTGPFRIKIKWKIDKKSDNPDYDYDSLHRIFSKYGRIAALVTSPMGKSRAIVEYERQDDAETAVKTEMGFVHTPLTLEKLWKTAGPDDEKQGTEPLFDNLKSSKIGQNGKDTTRQQTQTTATVTTTANTGAYREEPKMSDAEFERLVLGNLRRAEEKKREQQAGGTSGSG